MTGRGDPRHRGNRLSGIVVSADQSPGGRDPIGCGLFVPRRVSVMWSGVVVVGLLGVLAFLYFDAKARTIRERRETDELRRRR
jgi:hypothetical protein